MFNGRTDGRTDSRTHARMDARTCGRTTENMVPPPPVVGHFVSNRRPCWRFGLVVVARESGPVNLLYAEPG